MYLWVLDKFKGPKSLWKGSYTSSYRTASYKYHNEFTWSTLKKYASSLDYGGLLPDIQYNLSNAIISGLITMFYTFNNFNSG